MERNEPKIRIGARIAPKAARDYAELLSRETRDSVDDGHIILHAGEGEPTCPDCDVGTLRWAEAGFVPWHRVCDRCGSHWDLHPITWGPARPKQATHCAAGRLPVHADDCDVYWEDAWSDEHGQRPCSCGRQAEIAAALAAFLDLVFASGGLVRWIDGQGEVPLDPSESLTDHDGPVEATWGDLVALITPAMWEQAERERQRMAGMAVVPCAWARRARFY